MSRGELVLVHVRCEGFEQASSSSDRFGGQIPTSMIVGAENDVTVELTGEQTVLKGYAYDDAHVFFESKWKHLFRHPLVQEVIDDL